MEIVIIGAGIAGLALAMNLSARGIPSRVFERAPEIKELGVGITLLPHATRELAALGLQDAIAALGIENKESSFFNRFGQFLYKEPRGRFGGYKYPEFGIHRGRLHGVLYRAALERVGQERIIANRTCVGVQLNESDVTVQFKETSTGAPASAIRADIVIACDGINSAVRRCFYPSEQPVFSGINTWRGITRYEPILGGRTYMRIGSIRTGKLVVYPIMDDVGGCGEQLINWVAEIEKPSSEKNDWNKPGRLEDFLPTYQDWKFDWLDVPELLRRAEVILEYPMVDKDPVERWTFGRVTFAGDAAHPMYPRGSNGAAQALIDARILSDLLRTTPEAATALALYERERLPATAKIVRTNRLTPPDYINMRVEELTGDHPFENLNDFISQEELREFSEQYKRIAGFSHSDLC
jgi:2-polyprenyl-6-methoxyphenol hydroxylase-like FAD-dependent oxidoreductase